MAKPEAQVVKRFIQRLSDSRSLDTILSDKNRICQACHHGPTGSGNSPREGLPMGGHQPDTQL